MTKLNDDQKTAEEREEVDSMLNLPESEKAPQKDRCVEKLYKILEEKQIAQKVINMWDLEVSNKSEFFNRQAEFLASWDEFIKTAPQGIFESTSNLHIPMTFWVVRTYHARMMQSLFNPEPELMVKARNSSSADIESDLEEYLKYALQSWSNNHEGIADVIDRWVFSWCSTGLGYVKWRWDAQYRKYIDTEISLIDAPPRYVSDQAGNLVPVPQVATIENEVNRTEKVFQGPILEFLNIEDVVNVGPDMVNFENSDAVIHRQWLTANDLWMYVERGIFDKESVEDIIEGGDDLKSGTASSLLKNERQRNSGESILDKSYDSDKYEILEAYISVDVDGSGIDSDVVVWIGKKSKKLLHATYLHRINRAGEIPIIPISFIKRSGTNDHNPMGLVELLYPIQKELDFIHNSKIDFGMLSSAPFGFYRSGSSVNPKELKIKPGTLLPLDNPQADVYFPQIGDRSNFGQNEEQVLYTMVERLTGISDISLGVMSGKQGPMRTAAGSRFFMNEMNANLDVPMKRLHRGWKKVVTYLLHMLQQRSVPGMEFRVTQSDGLTKYRKLVDPADIAGDYDIELNTTSAASNKQIQFENAQNLLQLVQNPLLLQTGVVSPANVYEACKNYLKVLGVKDISKFLNSGMENQISLLPDEEFARIKMGLEVNVLPNSDHDGFINMVKAASEDPQSFGQLTAPQIQLLNVQAQKHIQMKQALEQLKAQQQQSQQQTINGQSSPNNDGM